MEVDEIRSFDKSWYCMITILKYEGMTRKNIPLLSSQYPYLIKAIARASLGDFRAD